MLSLTSAGLRIEAAARLARLPESGIARLTVGTFGGLSTMLNLRLKQEKCNET